MGKPENARWVVPLLEPNGFLAKAASLPVGREPVANARHPNQHSPKFGDALGRVRFLLLEEAAVVYSDTVWQGIRFAPVRPRRPRIERSDNVETNARADICSVETTGQRQSLLGKPFLFSQFPNALLEGD